MAAEWDEAAQVKWFKRDCGSIYAAWKAMRFYFTCCFVMDYDGKRMMPWQLWRFTPGMKAIYRMWRGTE